MLALALGMGAGFAAFAVAGDRRGRRTVGDDGGRAGWIAVGLLMVVGLAGILSLVLGSILVVILAPVVFAAMVTAVRFEGRHAAQRKQRTQVPVVAEVLAQRLRSGMTPLTALRSLSSAQAEVAGLTEVLNDVASGASLSAALANADEAAEPLLIAALQALEGSGANGAGVIERLADRLRLTAASEANSRAQAGQQLASATVMAGLPPVIAVLYGLSTPAAAEFYLHRPLGALVLGISFALSGASWVWMRWILATRAVR